MGTKPSQSKVILIRLLIVQRAQANKFRFARHRSFMYLLYDVIQLRNSCLGHSLLIKRSQWASVTHDLASLNYDRLRKAADEIATYRLSSDPLVRKLLKDITTIGARVPGSFFQKLQMRGELRGLIVREGMPAFWLTINPSDLQNPLVLVLAGFEHRPAHRTDLNSAMKRATATSDPVAVAKFFHYTCKAVLDGLLGGKPTELGVFGDVSNYFGVVESNGRGMLHLHTLVWVRGNLGFSKLRERILSDCSFADRMPRFLETVIMHGLHMLDDSCSVNTSGEPPSATTSISDSEFAERLFVDSNYVASTKQLHSKNHTETCFKYRKRGSAPASCRFQMPRSLVDVSKVDEFGIIHLSRNHAWTNPWNPSIASCIRSNHDISWIPTISKSLSLLYYITNYATKDDVSPGQMVAKAALLKQAIDRANSTSVPNAADSRLREKGMNKFALRCFNSLSQDREVSGVQVASTILQLPSYYTLNYNFTRIHIWWLRRYVQSLVRQSHHQGAPISSESIEEEPCHYDQSSNVAPSNIFDNYKLRGASLASLSIFEYGMVVHTKTLQNATTEDIPFDESHPRYRTHVQRVANSACQIATVTLQGELTEFQSSEDAIPGGHPLTTAIQSDLAEVLLGLFIPWQKLPLLFPRAQSSASNMPNSLWCVWTTVEPTLPPYIRTFAENINLLRKSKDDCQADVSLRSVAQDISLLDQELNEASYPESDPENEPMLGLQRNDDSIGKGTLLAAFLAIGRGWSKDATEAQRRIPTLISRSLPHSSFRFHTFEPIDMSDRALYESTGFRLLSSTTIQEMKTGFQNITNPSAQDTQTEVPFSLSSDLDDFNIGLTDGALLPTLADSNSLNNVYNHRASLAQSPTATSITAAVGNDIPLNEKQRLVVEKVMFDLLICVDSPYDSSLRKQSLLYVGGEGGVGKSQITKAIVAAMDLIRRREEVILMAPTGAAADAIGGSTYHTSLGISLNRYRRAGVSPRVRRLWSQKTVMIIDEISMVDLAALSIINTHCKVARSLDRSSTDLFGGLPIVILMGDFHQFPPVQGQPLWRIPRNETEEDGKLIWAQFKQVIILDEQMRQAEDVTYRCLLNRARSGMLTADDLATLNSKAISSLADPQLQISPAVVKLNSLRHVINRLQIERFARRKNQKIFVFPAFHTRTRSSGPTDLRLRADDLLGLPEQGAKVPFPGLILYTLSMPTMVLTNICTPAGLVNSATGLAAGVAVDPEGKIPI